MGWRPGLVFVCLLLAAGVSRAQDGSGSETGGSGGEPRDDEPALSIGPRGTETTIHRPSAARRVVRTFEFDTETIDPGGLPENWVRAQDDPAVPRDRPGFPLWNLAQVDLTRPGYNGSGGSVMLPTRGGSTSLLLRPGVISVLPGADYLVTTVVRTEGTRHAQVELVARLLDASGEAIEGSEKRSEPMGPLPTWEPVTLILHGEFEQAAFLQIELLLLQPREFMEQRLPDELHVWPADTEGMAWFDEIAVIQAPRVDVKTRSISNVIASEDAPVLDVSVRDLADEELDVRLTAFDARGNVVEIEDLRAVGGRLVDVWPVGVDQYGWYRAVCEVSARGRLIGAASVDFVWMPPPVEGSTGANAASSGRDRIGLAASKLPLEVVDAFDDVTQKIGAGHVVLPVYGEEGSARAGALTSLAETMLTRAVDVTLLAGDLPEDVAAGRGLERGDTLGLVASPSEKWDDQLLSVVDRLGGAVRDWQIGPYHGSRIGLRSTISAEAEAAKRSLERLSPEPRIALPIGVEHEPTVELVSSAAATVIALDPELGVGATRTVVDGWFEIARGVEATLFEGLELQLAFDAEDWVREQVTPRAVAGRTLRRAFDAWHAVAQGQAESRTEGAVAEAPLRAETVLVDPWRVRRSRRVSLQPTPELAVWRTLSDALAYRAVTPDVLDLGPDLRALLIETVPGAESPRRPALVVWPTGASEGPMALDMLLSVDPVEVIDIFGNREPVPAVETGIRGVTTHHVDIGNEPLIIEGVDAELLRFQASVRLDPGILIAQTENRAHDLVFENPWDVTARGKFYIIEPGGGGAGGGASNKRWRISPRQAPVSVAKGLQGRIPLDVRFSPVEEAGGKDFVVDFELAAHRDYGRIRVKRQVFLGLPGVEFDLTFRRGPQRGGDDIFVEARVFNTGADPITVELRAQGPGYPRDESVIADLGPEQSAVRVFAYGKGVQRLSGKRVSVSISVPSTGGRLTKSVTIPSFSGVPSGGG